MLYFSYLCLNIVIIDTVDMLYNCLATIRAGVFGRTALVVRFFIAKNKRGGVQ